MLDQEIDFKAAAYEHEIIRLWDAFPDYVKTVGLLEQIKYMANESIYHQLVPMGTEIP